MENLIAIVASSLDSNHSISLSKMQQLLDEAQYSFFDLGFVDLPDMIEGVDTLFLTGEGEDAVVTFDKSLFPLENETTPYTPPTPEPATPEQIEEVKKNLRPLIIEMLKKKPNPEYKVPASQLIDLYRKAGYQLPQDWKMMQFIEKYLTDDFGLVLNDKGNTFAFVRLMDTEGITVMEDDDKKDKDKRDKDKKEKDKKEKDKKEKDKKNKENNEGAKPEDKDTKSSEPIAPLPPAQQPPADKIRCISRIKFYDFFYCQDQNEMFAQLEQLADPASVYVAIGECETDPHFYTRTCFAKNFAELAILHPDQILISYDSAEFNSGFYTTEGKAICVQLEVNRQRNATRYQSFVFEKLKVQE